MISVKVIKFIVLFLFFSFLIMLVCICILKNIEIKRNQKSIEKIIKVLDSIGLGIILVLIVYVIISVVIEKKLPQEVISLDYLDGYVVESDIIGYETIINKDEILHLRYDTEAVGVDGIIVSGSFGCHVIDYEGLESIQSRDDEYKSAIEASENAIREQFYLMGNDVVFYFKAKVSFDGYIENFEITDAEFQN